MSGTLPGMGERPSCHRWNVLEPAAGARCSCCASATDVRWCGRCYTYACRECRDDGEADTAGECGMSTPPAMTPAQAWADIERRLRELGYSIDAKGGKHEWVVCIVAPNGAPRLAKVGPSALCALVSAASKLTGVITEEHEEAAHWERMRSE